MPLARQGHDVVYETGLLEEAWVEDLLRETAALRLFHVELEIGLDEVRARERARRDRPDGYSEGSYARVLRPFPGALRLDAGAMGPEERAQAVRRFVEG